MGLLDNLRNRLRRTDEYVDDIDEADYYGDYGNDDAYRDAYGDVYYEDEGDAAFDGYDDAGYSYPAQRSGTAPLINMADIRSQPVGLDRSRDRGIGSREDRIPQPVVRERRPSSMVGGLAEDDSEAFRDSLARSAQNSLPQLHSERIQLEANMMPDLGATGSAPNDRRSVEAANQAIGNYRAGSKINSGAVLPRSSRQLQHLRPKSYADAEAISISLRQGAAVVLDLTDVRPELAKRILDFSFGVTSAFEGQVDRYADRVYILTRNGSLTEVEMARIEL